MRLLACAGLRAKARAWCAPAPPHGLHKHPQKRMAISRDKPTEKGKGDYPERATLAKPPSPKEPLEHMPRGALHRLAMDTQ